MLYVIRFYLQSVHHLPHVSFTDLHDVVDRLICDLDVLLVANAFQSACGMCIRNLPEFEPGCP